MADIVETVESVITGEVLEYSRQKLRDAEFFSELESGAISLDQLKYIFEQYRFWRDQFHTWFGVCIVKSGSCENHGVAQAIGNLAEHIVIEMREDHSQLYREFLKNLGISEHELRHSRKGDVTSKYERSFIEAFGTANTDFVESVAALAGRELFAALRNSLVIKWLELNYGIKSSQWWALHEELEEEHFRACLGPLVQARFSEKREGDRLLTVIRQEIDRHVDYWDGLLMEARANATGQR